MLQKLLENIRTNSARIVNNNLKYKNLFSLTSKIPGSYMQVFTVTKLKVKDYSAMIG